VRFGSASEARPALTQIERTGTRGRGEAGPGLAVRRAVPADVTPLAALERRAFTTDRLSRESLRRLIGGGRNIVLVAVAGPRIVGYAVAVLRRGSGIVRLYSIARDPAAGEDFPGVGRRLLIAVEEAARAAGAVEIRLEVRPDNAAALRLYHSLGYVVFARADDYYEDHADALRMRKPLAERGPS
jgi:ribosomal protein S18 acetylase RimI-like enzyme